MQVTRSPGRGKSRGLISLIDLQLCKFVSKTGVLDRSVKPSDASHIGNNTLPQHDWLVVICASSVTVDRDTPEMGCVAPIISSGQAARNSSRFAGHTTSLSEMGCGSVEPVSNGSCWESSLGRVVQSVGVACICQSATASPMSSLRRCSTRRGECAVSVGQILPVGSGNNGL
jgi:hypothetical protein